MTTREKLEEEIKNVRELDKDINYFGAQTLADLAEAYIEEASAELTVYCTTKNSGPSWHSDPLHLVYIGNSFKLAEEAVGDFRRYEKEQHPQDPKSWSILPRTMDYQMVKYYMADGWWYSIVKFKLVDPIKAPRRSYILCENPQCPKAGRCGGKCAESF